MLLDLFHEDSYRAKELVRTFDADYVNHNDHRKHAERSNYRVSIAMCVLDRFRNDSNCSGASRPKAHLFLSILFQCQNQPSKHKHIFTYSSLK